MLYGVWHNKMKNSNIMQTTQNINPVISIQSPGTSDQPLPLTAHPTHPLTTSSRHPPPRPNPLAEPVDAKRSSTNSRRTSPASPCCPSGPPKPSPCLSCTPTLRWRDVSTYLGIEVADQRCGQDHLLELLNELAHRAVAAANISPPRSSGSLRSCPHPPD